MSNVGMSEDEVSQVFSKQQRSQEFIPDNYSLDEEDYIQELTIEDNKTIIIDLTWLINLKGGITSNKSDLELEIALEQINYYLFSFLKAYEYVSSKYYHIKDTFDTEYQIKYSIVEETMIEENQRKGLSKSNWVPPKTSIEANLMKNYQEWYLTNQNELRRLERKKRYLSKVLDMINSRASHLQTIINKRRYEIGTGSNVG